MSSPTLITPTTSTPKLLLTPPIKSKLTFPTSNAAPSSATRRDFLSIAAGIFAPAAALLLPLSSTQPAWAEESSEYVKESNEVINKVRTTITMDRNDPNIATAVADLRESSNYWVAKYRREKSLLGKPSFRDLYSALNAVSGHYISFGPTAPIPKKRKDRILEEVDTAEKALLRGR